MTELSDQINRAEVAKAKEFLRFADLKALGIVASWTTLQRWIRRNGFPPGTKIGPATRVWSRQEIDDFQAARRAAEDSGHA